MERQRFFQRPLYTDVAVMAPVIFGTLMLAYVLVWGIVTRLDVIRLASLLALFAVTFAVNGAIFAVLLAGLRLGLARLAAKR